MRIYVPLHRPAVWFQDAEAFQSLSNPVKDKLVSFMQQIITDDDLQDSFDFGGSYFFAQFDLARGEKNFRLEYALDRVLLLRGFQPTLASLEAFPGIVPSFNPAMSQITLYQLDEFVVIVASEVQDRGKHKYIEVRFALADPRFA